MDNKAQAIVNRERAMDNKAQAIVNRERAMDNKAQAIVNRERAMVKSVGHDNRYKEWHVLQERGLM